MMTIELSLSIFVWKDRLEHNEELISCLEHVDTEERPDRFYLFNYILDIILNFLGYIFRLYVVV